ncbi:MAG: response regulator [Actinomycetota bacterium]|jgi:CheY-like chemotaxis protein
MTPSVLIIDDEEHIREVAQVTLETMAGWNVVTAGSGEEGIARALAEPPDVILLDVMMPEMDGPTTVGVLKGNDATKDIPIVLLTAKVQAEDHRSFMDLGVNGVIAKPFNPLTLADEVSRTLGWAP